VLASQSCNSLAAAPTKGLFHNQLANALSPCQTSAPSSTANQRRLRIRRGAGQLEFRRQAVKARMRSEPENQRGAASTGACDHSRAAQTGHFSLYEYKPIVPATTQRAMASSPVAQRKPFAVNCIHVGGPSRLGSHAVPSGGFDTTCP